MKPHRNFSPDWTPGVMIPPSGITTIPMSRFVPLCWQGISAQTATEDRTKTGSIDQDLRNWTTTDVDFGTQKKEGNHILWVRLFNVLKKQQIRRSVVAQYDNPRSYFSQVFRNGNKKNLRSDALIAASPFFSLYTDDKSWQLVEQSKDVVEKYNFK